MVIRVCVAGATGWAGSAVETIFGLPDKRLIIRHDAGSGAEPYVGGTLLAVSKVMDVRGLVRGLEQLLF